MPLADEFQVQAPGYAFRSQGWETTQAKAVTGATTLTVEDQRTVSANTTAAAYVLTLPERPYDGQEWRIYDGAAAGSWQTNTLTLNGNTINIVTPGSAPAASLSLTTRGGNVRVRYDAAMNLWVVLS